MVGKICARITPEGVLIQPKVCFNGPEWKPGAPFGGSGFAGFHAVITPQQATELGFDVPAIAAGRQAAKAPTVVDLNQPVVITPQVEVVDLQPAAKVEVLAVNVPNVAERLAEVRQEQVGVSKAQQAMEMLKAGFSFEQVTQILSK